MSLLQVAWAQEEGQRRPRPAPVPFEPDQIQPPMDGNVPCPDPQIINLSASAPSAAFIDSTQFPPPSNPEPNFGGTTSNRVFQHTFQFKLPENKCCQCTGVTLTLKLKALQDAFDPPNTPPHSTSNASNDKWYIYKDGKLCGSTDGWVYDNPVSQGTVITKTIRVPCECVAYSGGVGKLTFVIQDDTSVLSATMNARGCCVKRQGQQ